MCLRRSEGEHVERAGQTPTKPRYLSGKTVLISMSLHSFQLGKIVGRKDLEGKPISQDIGLFKYSRLWVCGYSYLVVFILRLTEGLCQTQPITQMPIRKNVLSVQLSTVMKYLWLCKERHTSPRHGALSHCTVLCMVQLMWSMLWHSSINEQNLHSLSATAPINLSCLFWSQHHLSKTLL